MRHLLCLFVLSLLVSSARAAETSAQEIEFLVNYIKNSKVRFIRGGTEYSAQEGADHMRTKLARAGTRVKTAEDFISGIATKSYLRGDVYKVRIANGKSVETGPWLTEALRTHRQNASRL